MLILDSNYKCHQALYCSNGVLKMTLSEKTRRESLRRKYMLILDLKNTSLGPLGSQKVPLQKFKQDVRRQLCFFKYTTKEKLAKKKRM